MKIDFDEFLNAYLECALWSSNDPDTGEPLDDTFIPEDITGETLEQAKKDCQSFINKVENVEGKYRFFSNFTDSEQAGHDFWLTRNRHGAGFRNDEWKKGNTLYDIAHEFRECDLYVGDDGKLYFS